MNLAAKVFEDCPLEEGLSYEIKERFFGLFGKKVIVRGKNWHGFYEITHDCKDGWILNEVLYLTEKKNKSNENGNN